MSLRCWVGGAALAGAYWGLALVGQKFSVSGADVVVIWPATGLALAAFLLWGPWVAPAVFVGMLVSEWGYRHSFLMGMALAAVGASGIALAARLIIRTAGGGRFFETLPDVVRYLGWTSLLCYGLMAPLSVGVLVLGGDVSADSFNRNWFVWGMSETMAMWVLTPFLLAWKPPFTWRDFHAPRLAGTFWFILCVLVAGGVFFPVSPLASLHVPLGTMGVPLLALIAFRFGVRGVTAATLLFSGSALWGTTQGVGPFAVGESFYSLMSLQMYIASLALTALLLTALIEEREAYERQAFLASEPVLRSLLAHAPDAIWMSDREDHCVFINEVAAAALGLKASDIVGRRIEEIANPELAQRFRAGSDELKATGKVSVQEEMFHNVAGEDRYFELMRFPVKDPAGHRLGVIVIGRDVTERKRAELERAARTSELELAYGRLKELDRLKSDFINTVSHELRTPLTSIIGYAEFLEDQLGGELTSEQLGYVAQVLQGARRLTLLVDDLLDFARMEAGTFKLVQQESDLVPVVQEVLRSVKPQAEAGHLALTYDGPEAPCLLPMDAKRIEQVLINLVGNAIKFTRPGGSVTIRVRPDPEQVRVEVRDTGIGISSEHLPRLFEKFYQVDPSSTREHGGTGLGLSIVEGLLAAHGGRIEVASEPGKGSVFTFWLSRRARSADGTPA